MELPLRSKGDELLPAGSMLSMRDRLRVLAGKHPDLATVIAYSFDFRTRMLPYLWADKRMVPAGSRELAAALVDAGFDKTRLVLGQWSRGFDAAQMQLDGRVPDLFLASSLSVHSAHFDEMLAQVHRIPEAQRPLVLAGGPHILYEPWRAFGIDANAPWGADVAVTGEVYVFLELLEALLASRAEGESMRSVFMRLKASGGLDHIPGLVYPLGERAGVAEELVDTGVQRLLRDFDELPSPVLGYSVLEAPGRRPTLAARPLEAGKVKRYGYVSSITITQGCKFRCPYCPIPAYNQHQDRGRSPERLAEDFRSLNGTYGLSWFFGTDDNFFNRHDRTLAILEELARAKAVSGKPLGRTIRWGTEVTVHDTYEMREHLKLARAAGMRALWLGVEDMTATFVKKGQSVNRTEEVFAAMRKAGIHPMPMMMHDDTQPLLSFKDARGLLNQTYKLRKAGAMTYQLTSLLPAAGTKLYKETFQSGLAFDEVGGKPVPPHKVDGNFIVASHAKRPWRRQLNLLASYTFFYNPIRFLWALVRPKCTRGYFQDAVLQFMGMGALLVTWVRMPAWSFKLLTRKITRATEEPRAKIPMRAVGGGPAPHDMPPGPDPKKLRRLEPSGALPIPDLAPGAAGVRKS